MDAVFKQVSGLRVWKGMILRQFNKCNRVICGKYRTDLLVSVMQLTHLLCTSGSFGRNSDANQRESPTPFQKSFLTLLQSDGSHAANLKLTAVI